METEEKQYPKGTTKEQWDRYELEVRSHEQFIERYKFFVDRVINLMEFYQPGRAWTSASLREFMNRRISEAESMDAPNKPGYHRANND